MLWTYFCFLGNGQSEENVLVVKVSRDSTIF